MEMGNVLKFKSRDERRVEEVLTQLTDQELEGNLNLLRSGCIMQYYRFGPPTLQIDSSHLPLVLAEMGKRGMTYLEMVSGFMEGVRKYETLADNSKGDKGNGQT